MPTRSPVSSCSSTTSSRKSIIGNEDSKPCISSASKLNLKKNFRSQVVPLNCNDNLNMADGYAIKDNIDNQKEFEDLSLIRKQLLQIENQQSNLLDLLQVLTSLSFNVIAVMFIHSILLTVLRLVCSVSLIISSILNFFVLV